MNLRLITFILTFLGPILGLNASIYKHTVLKHPTIEKRVYLYFDVHLPLQINNKQMEMVDQVIKRSDGATILTECTRLDMRTFPSSKPVLKPLFNFPEKVTSHIKQQVESYTGAPGNLNDQFLTKLSNHGKTAGANFIYADDNRLTINNGMSYLWMIGWVAPLARLVGLDTTGAEQELANRNPDTMLLSDLLNATKQSLEKYINELKNLNKVNKGKQLAEKIQEVQGIIKQYDTIATHIQKFAGPATTLGQFRAKANKHAENLTKKLGADKEVVKAQLEEVLSTEFEKFFSPAVQCYIFKPYNALDSSLLNSILFDEGTKPVVAYIGGAHARIVQQELIQQGYTVIEESQVRAIKAGKLTLYKEFDNFLASYKKPLSFTAAEVAKIGTEFLGPAEQAFLAPLKNR